MSQEERKSQEAVEQVSTKDGASQPRKEGGMTRRKMLAVSAAGVAIALPGITALYRWVSDDKLVIIIEGPFEEYGYLPPERLDFEGTDRFGLRLIKFDEDKYKDEVFVSILFKGEEDPDRVMDIGLSVIGKSGICVAQRQDVVRDPRIAAKAQIALLKSEEEMETILFPDFTPVTLSLDFPKGIRLPDIARLRLEIEERQDPA